MTKPPKLKTAQDFIWFFEPLDNWCVNTLNDGHGNRCAIGHLNEAFSGDTLHCPESSEAVNRLARLLGEPRPGYAVSKIVDVNNGENHYIRKDIRAKRRILAALREAAKGGK